MVTKDETLKKYNEIYELYNVKLDELKKVLENENLTLFKKTTSELERYFRQINLVTNAIEMIIETKHLEDMYKMLNEELLELSEYTEKITKENSEKVMNYLRTFYFSLYTILDKLK